MAILKLSPDIINKIAAGEVVERPASVVKELVENSIDAGASDIEIEITNGGKDYIRVQDNGFGMNSDDALLSIEQHATSKIQNIDDLFSLNSFGFRGEALASISSVSDFILQTKQIDSTIGTEVRVENNNTVHVEVGCKHGTRVEVKNLFKNIPARRHYLKSTTTEYNHVLDTFTQFALCHPDITFTLMHNDKRVYHLASTQNLKTRIENIFKKDIVDVLIPCFYEEDSFSLSGFIGKPHNFSQSRAYQYLCINDRFIKSPILHKAILAGYGSLLPHGTQPVYVLNVKLDSELVDVNVHPRKLEVRFSDSQFVFRFVVRGINHVLRSGDVNKEITIPERNISEARGVVSSGRSYNPASQGALGMFRFGGVNPKSSINFTRELLRSDTDSQKIEQSNLIDIGDWKLLGQIKDSYLLVESGDRGLFIIDQHGAAERVNYDRLLSDYKNDSGVKKQQLLIPLTIEVAHKEFGIIMERREDFEKIGFDIDAFGEKTISVQSVPTIITSRDQKKIVEEIIADLVDNGTVESFTIDYMLKTIACKSAIKFGDRLTLEEQLKLVHDIRYTVDNHLACAHGRPILLELTWDYINRRFERT